MRRVHAVAAPAQVVELKAGFARRQGAALSLPYHAMRLVYAAQTRVEDLTIPRRVTTGLPNPTSVWHLDVSDARPPTNLYISHS